MSSHRAAFSQRLQHVTHYLTAFVLIMKGVAKLDHPEGYWPFIVLCWIAGSAILLVTALHGRLHARFPRIEVGVYLLESFVCGAVAYLTFSAGTRAQALVWLAAAAGFTVAAAAQFARGQREGTATAHSAEP